MRQQRFSGHRPKIGSGFHYVMRYNRWMIYANEVGEGYVNFKFVYDGRKAGKANYSFTYVREFNRFVANADTARFLTDFPEGIAQLILMLANTFNFRSEFYATKV